MTHFGDVVTAQSNETSLTLATYWIHLNKKCVNMFNVFTLEMHNYKLSLPTNFTPVKHKPWCCTRTVKEWRWGEQGQMEHASATVNLWPWQGWMWERFSFISCKYLWAVSQPDSGGWEVVNISGWVSKILLLFFWGVFLVVLFLNQPWVPGKENSSSQVASAAFNVCACVLTSL